MQVLRKVECAKVIYPVVCRQVCLDALVEEGDTDLDWRLSLGEYSSLLGQGYTPSLRGE